MKKNCDHCDANLNKEYQGDCAIWCQQCVEDNVDLLNSLGLVDASGYPITIHKDTFFFFRYTHNVEKILAVPKKNAPISAPTPVPQPAPSIDPPVSSFNFEEYNCTFAGKRYGQ